MYQVPVGSIEKIRNARRRVKQVLSQIGLEDCQDLLKELNENAEENADDDEVFQETEWVDFTGGFRKRHQKKWPYRSRPLCCNMCRFSNQNIYNFRGHVSRRHGFAQAFCELAACSHCRFIGHPKTVKKHALYFHIKNATLFHRGNQRYQCRRCGIPNAYLFPMKKHVILKHLESVAEQYIGYSVNAQGSPYDKIYCCKMCKVDTGSLDQLLHHILEAPSHYSVSMQVQSMIQENKDYTGKQLPSIAPKLQPPQIFNSNSMVVPGNGQPARTVLTLQQLKGAANSTTLFCTPGTNQTFLPPQASRLVQLASAEAKGLLQPGATISLRNALPQGSPSLLQLPAVSNVPLKPSPAAAPPPQTPQAQQILVPTGMQANVVPASKPAVATQNASTNQMALQGTMLTSQSLLSHLIPTGNRVNGLPTYTFAPLQMAVPLSRSAGPPLKAVEQTSNSVPQTKKWITCPLCNELFPSSVFDMHTEVAHQTKSSSSKSESVAARAEFLKKMPDKTVKCLTCKILLSEKSVFQHLLHGLSCLYCSALFFSIKQLAEHVKQHNPNNKAYCDFLRQKYRVYSKGIGGILFPYFDVHTTAPKEVLGDTEVNLALVTHSLELIFFKLQPSDQQEICPAPLKINSAYCPFCDEKFENEPKHLQHLKQKHFVAPTIHAILKTEAFKCIYCNGVYTGKVTQQAVKLHIQRCRCSPKPQVQAPPPKPAATPQPPPPAPKPTPPPPPQPSKPVQQLLQTSGLYFLQVPQGMTVQQTLARVIQPAPSAQVLSEVCTAEMQSKQRLEAALRKVLDDNKREREEKEANRQKREQVKMPPLPPPPPPPPPVEPEPQVEPAAAAATAAVKLLLEPTLVERRCSDGRRDFISKYFNLNPYANKAENDELCRRLSLTKSELASHFSRKRSKCMRSLKRNTAAILLGFNMNEMRRLKHNLLLPEQRPAEPAEAKNKRTENAEETPAPTDRSGNQEVSEEVEQMESLPECVKKDE